MLVTLLGMVAEVSLLQPVKAYSPMLVTLFGIMISPVAAAEHANNSVLDASRYTKYPSTYPFTLLAPHGEPVAEPVYTMLGTRLKALSPMFVTLLGMVTDVRLQQP